METPSVVVETKAKRVLTEDQLEKLSRARELALIKRREMAAVRKTEKEALIVEKMNVRAERDHKHAEKEATRRLGGPTPVTTTEEAPVTTESEPSTESEPPTESVEVPVVTKVKRKAVIVETSDSDEDEGMIDNARVFVVKRQISAPVTPAPAPPTAPVHVAPIDPHATLYKSMFG